jgi:hypothetical protein
LQQYNASLSAMVTSLKPPVPLSADFCILQFYRKLQKSKIADFCIKLHLFCKFLQKGTPFCRFMEILDFCRNLQKVGPFLQKT